MTEFTRRLLALVAGCLLLTAVPATAAPAAPAGVETFKGVKVHAKADKAKVKVNEKVRIRGSLEIPARSEAAETVIIQSLQAGVWVDLRSTSCRPNSSFSLSLSFSVSAQLTLRAYHPATTLYAAASSETFVLLVV
ncbi:hypothetical protein [Amycolatopsis albispora]|uniref:DUF5666 domain-containing protein n=1 Tax=Amycolatopsis albispora TaxID=1804986 RepID=A0A344L6C6_9PSEU|nr:hypothetical protein [Amycolatopsis albispora]AXB43600.1 hypothetical protein A4R43_14515 [Amycolatopsis albispora]